MTLKTLQRKSGVHALGAATFALCASTVHACGTQKGTPTSCVSAKHEVHGFLVRVWQGKYCQTPGDCSGSLDARGGCCSAELSADGECCAEVDADMACCVSAELDGSGTCLGPASSVDLQGHPCQVCCLLHLPTSNPVSEQL